MKATITQLDFQRLDSDLENLSDHIKNHKSELVLLPEMCFSKWFCTTQATNDDVWEQAVHSHDKWLNR